MEETKKKQIPKHLVDVGFPHSARVGDMKRRLSKFLDTPWIDMKIKEERAKNIHIYIFYFFRNEIFRRKGMRTHIVCSHRIFIFWVFRFSVGFKGAIIPAFSSNMDRKVIGGNEGGGKPLSYIYLFLLFFSRPRRSFFSRFKGPIKSPLTYEWIQIIHALLNMHNIFLKKMGKRQAIWLG